MKIGKMPPEMAHFPGEGKHAVVMYSYADRYGCGVEDEYCLALMPEESQISWYPEEILTPDGKIADSVYCAMVDRAYARRRGQ